MENYSLIETPKPSEKWVNLEPLDRIQLCKTKLKNKITQFHFEILDAKDDGQVIIEFENTPSANERGMLLLDLEELLKSIDDALTIWHVSLGDKNSLRNLRGITLKNEKEF